MRSPRSVQQSAVKAVSYVVPAVALVLILSYLVKGCSMERTPDRLLLPKGYRGEILVEYRVAGAPELKVEDGHFILPIPRNGHLSTSTSREDGWASDDDAYYVDYSGKRTRIPNANEPTHIGAKPMGPPDVWWSFGSTGGSSDSASTYQTYFVGTSADASSKALELTGPMSHPAADEYGRYRGSVDHGRKVDMRSAFASDSRNLTEYLRALATEADKPKDWGAEAVLKDILADRSTNHEYKREFLAGYAEAFKIGASSRRKANDAPSESK